MNKFLKWSIGILSPVLLSAAISWCNWVTNTLYGIKQDIAVIKSIKNEEVSDRRKTLGPVQSSSALSKIVGPESRSNDPI